MTEFSLGDLSIHNGAGKQESADVQAKVADKFIDVLERHLPEGGNVAESIPLSTSWRIRVVFSTRETDTDEYRKNVKRAFPGAEVTTLAQGGDSWRSWSLVNETTTGPNGSVTTPTALTVNQRLGATESKIAEPVAPGVYALRA